MILFNPTKAAALTSLANLPIIFSLKGDITSQFFFLGEKIVVDLSTPNLIYCAFTSRPSIASGEIDLNTV